MKKFIKNTLFALCLSLALSACIPVVQKFQVGDGKPELHDNYILTGDGEKLPVVQWLPEATKNSGFSFSSISGIFGDSEDDYKPDAVVIALHGFNDYSNAFANAGRYLSHHNIALIAYDQRGFGKTKHNGIWAGNENLAQDVSYAVAAAADKFPDIPIYLLGESMGGAVVINALANKNLPQVKGAILSAPAVWGDETMNGFYRVTLWLIAHSVPNKKMTGEGLKILPSDNIAMLRELGRDPLVIKQTRVDSIYGIMSLMDSAYRNIDNVKKPLLLLYGAKDRVIPRGPLHKVSLKMDNMDNVVSYYPDGYHMLLRDLKSKIVLDDVVSWIRNSEMALPSGYDKMWRQEFGLADKNNAKVKTAVIIEKTANSININKSK